MKMGETASRKYGFKIKQRRLDYRVIMFGFTKFYFSCVCGKSNTKVWNLAKKGQDGFQENLLLKKPKNVQQVQKRLLEVKKETN